MNRQLLIAVLMLFSGSIATAHAETLSAHYDQAVATSTEALEQAADSTKEWAGKTSEQLQLPQKYDEARNSVDKATEQVKTGWDKTREKLQLQQKYDTMRNSVDGALNNVQSTWNAPENKAARAEAANSTTTAPAANSATGEPARTVHPAQQPDASGHYPDPAQ